jgi:superfamily II DNA or RNA helicase
LSKKEHRLLTVITTPYGHLTRQWIRNAETYGVCAQHLVADASNPGWKDELADALLDMRNQIRPQIVLFTTHTTFGTEDFVRLVKESDAPVLLVADEVHGIGAPERRNGLVSEYTYRLGLSATPKRWFDEEGTAMIYDYFGPVVYEFSLYRGIHELNETTNLTYLVPYEYIPHFVELNDQEAIEYRSVTEKIAKRFFAIKDKTKRLESLELLYFERARILDDAAAKYQELGRILDEIGHVQNCLIYCSPRQLPIVQDILNDRNIVQHKFTMEEGVTPSEAYDGKSEREYILDRFAEGKYRALVAMRCLDEGVDVPPARIAILMASSSNPREFIQRRGRILRRYENKSHATIYDIIVLPTITPSQNADSVDKDIERKIMKGEMDRFKEFANDADNSVDCLRVINDLQRKLLGH